MKQTVPARTTGSRPNWSDKGAEDELPQRQAHHKNTEGQLTLCLGGTEVVDHVGNRGKVKVRGNRGIGNEAHQRAIGQQLPTPGRGLQFRVVACSSTTGQLSGTKN